MQRMTVAFLFAASGLLASIPAHALELNVNLGGSPVVVAPGGESQGNVSEGWHGDRYYDGQRYWQRNEWEAHQADMRRNPDGMRGREANMHNQDGMRGRGADMDNRNDMRGREADTHNQDGMRGRGADMDNRNDMRGREADTHNQDGMRGRGADVDNRNGMRGRESDMRNQDGMRGSGADTDNRNGMRGREADMRSNAGGDNQRGNIERAGAANGQSTRRGQHDDFGTGNSTRQ
ncbi:hypothetical protein [Paraburkholderia dinghuensis]|uniref:hypothetical protein n=1 Tax=Paraburkholderia dinghuensis TaxID=2305225 RepID=UPI001FE248AD|nr:hypothetical protein [Paraburkholderia dinghuensis]